MTHLDKLSRPGRRSVLRDAVAPLALIMACGSAIAAPPGLPDTAANLANVTLNAGYNSSAVTGGVTVNASRAYIEWNSFNIAPGNTFTVSGSAQPGWILVNKVTGSSPSTIGGTLNSGGQVWILNTNGVSVNSGAMLNVAGLVLSTGAWTTADRNGFLGGANTISFNSAASSIVMNGTVNASGGVVALLAPTVSIGGVITETNGHGQTVTLAVAAQDVSLAFDPAGGANLVLDGVTITKGADGGGVTVGSAGSVTADRIVMAATGATAASSIVVSGALTATAARGDGEDVVLMTTDQVNGGVRPVLASGALPTGGPTSSAGGDIRFAPSGVNNDPDPANPAALGAGAMILAAGTVALGDIANTVGSLAIDAVGNVGPDAGAAAKLIAAGDITARGANVGLGDLTAAGDVAIRAVGADPVGGAALAVGAALAGGNVVLRSDAGSATAASLASGQTVTIAGTGIAPGHAVGALGAHGAGYDLANTAGESLTLFGVADYDTTVHPLTNGGTVDVSARTVSVAGSTTAGVAGSTTTDNIWVTATGADPAGGSALGLSGPVTATQDVALDAASATAGSILVGGAIAAGRDVAARSAAGSVATASANAGDDIALRAVTGLVTVTGSLTTGALTDGAAAIDDGAAGAADGLVGLSPMTAFDINGNPGVSYGGVSSGHVIDVVAGGSLTVTGSVTADATAFDAAAAGDARLRSLTSFVATGDVFARRDGVIDAFAYDGSGALTAGRDVADLARTQNITVGPTTAADDVVLRASTGSVTVAGTLSGGTTGAVVDALGAGAGDALASASPLTVFGTAGYDTTVHPLTVGGTVDVSARMVSVTGSTTAGVAGATTTDNVWVVSTGADPAGGSALSLSGAVSATQDVALDETSATAGSILVGGPIAAGRDAAARAVAGSVATASTNAGDDIVLRSPQGSIHSAALTAGTGTDGSGAGDVLGAALPSTAFATSTYAGVTYGIETGGANIDLAAGTPANGMAPMVVGTITVTGPSVAGSASIPSSDARFMATGSVTLSDVSAWRDVVIQGAAVTLSGATGLTAGRDIAVNAYAGDVTSQMGTAGMSAGDDVVVRASGMVTIGSLGAGTGQAAGAGGPANAGADLAAGAGDVLAAGSPLSVFSPTSSLTYTDLTIGQTVDVDAARITVNGSVSALGQPTSDVHLRATGPVFVTGSGVAQRDVAIQGSNVSTGGLSAGRDIAVEATTTDLTIDGSAVAGDDVVLRATNGSVTVTNTLAVGTTGTVADATGIGAGDALASASPLTVFGTAGYDTTVHPLTVGGTVDVSARMVSVTGSATAGVAGATTTDNVWVVSTGADPAGGSALSLSGAVSATQDVALDETSATAGSILVGGAIAAGRDAAARSVAGSVATASTNASDDIVLRASKGQVTVTGSLTTGALADGVTAIDDGAAGAADVLVGVSPITVFDINGAPGVAYGGVSAAHTIDVVAGGSLTVTGAVTADATAFDAASAGDARLRSLTSFVATGDVFARRDVVVDAFTSAISGNLTGRRDVADLARSQAISIGVGPTTAGDDIVLRAPTGSVTVAGTLAAGTTGSVADNAGAGAGDALARVSPLTVFGTAGYDTTVHPLTAGGSVDVSALTVSVTGSTTAGVAGATTADNIWVVSTGADPAVGSALSLSGGVGATQDVALDETSATAGSILVGGAIAAGRDLAARSVAGSVATASANASDDIVLRASKGAVTVTGSLTTGALTDGATAIDGAAAGAADVLIGVSPMTVFDINGKPGVAYGGVSAAHSIDVVAGGSLTVTGAVTADATAFDAASAGDARLRSLTSFVATGDVFARRDVVIDAFTYDSSGALKAGRDVADLARTQNITIGAATAADDVGLAAANVAAPGVITAGAIKSGQAIAVGSQTIAGGADNAANGAAGDILAGDVAPIAVRSLAGQPSLPPLATSPATQVFLAATKVTFSSLTAGGNSDVFVVSTSTSPVHVGGASDAANPLITNAEIGAVTAGSLNVFSGADPSAARNLDVRDISFTSSLQTIRLYAGNTDTVDVSGNILGGGLSGGTLIVGDAGTSSSRPTAFLPPTYGSQWTPNVIVVTGGIGASPSQPNGTTAIASVALAANDIYISPQDDQNTPSVAKVMDNTADLGKLQTALLPDTQKAGSGYVGGYKVQVAATTLTLLAKFNILERNLNPQAAYNLNLDAGLQVGFAGQSRALVVNTLTVQATPLQHINLFGTVNGFTGSLPAVGAKFLDPTATNAPLTVLYSQPAPATVAQYQFNSCVLGGGCFVPIPPVAIGPLPNPDQIGDLADPGASFDEEPITDDGGELLWAPPRSKESPQ